MENQIFISINLPVGTILAFKRCILLLSESNGDISLAASRLPQYLLTKVFLASYIVLGVIDMYINRFYL